jgi:hypothetical protein
MVQSSLTTRSSSFATALKSKLWLLGATVQWVGAVALLNTEMSTGP